MINDFFRIRIQTSLLSRNDQEYRTIIYFQVITILHEIAHIMLRWSGRSTTPSRLCVNVDRTEAGELLEHRLLGDIFDPRTTLELPTIALDQVIISFTILEHHIRKFYYICAAAAFFASIF